ncbi:Terpenoid cyclases/protein prenyltransferase alpha-alpha toroid [Arabidopsis thaliana x Arabidopsis arenosa]|uniref:Terpenoid cyclases/protein prenyltransferase alpha-alpha toroid n=1 Tax=Arabidopsis thaliana x Arabidopsis arenosa TaxID=1240361 RepID=A0A8T2A503_9BRAS|nr:Terpenoid cyclases/protein prenyltransferase alpha-alpha toroid [Arabidopsis thaliana x Arabidopsis arenosa]
MAKITPGESPVVPRRSANYQPSLWDHRHLLSIKNKYAKDESVQERDFLKENVRKMLDDEKKTYLDKLELIDDLQKLGVSYHFEREIENILTFFYQKYRIDNHEKDLHATALEFRLFRQHGFNVSEDVFDVFMENCGKFESNNINDLISLYEASYLSTKSDTKLQKFIRTFATQKLRDFVDTHSNEDCGGSCDNDMVEMVVQALDMPYYWRMRRLATRCWWRETGLGNQLHFARDRIVENYFWTIGHIHEPQFGYVRRIMTKVNALITTIDDIYDIYGTLEELQLLTVAVENWDVNRLDELPEYMRLCFLVVYNVVNSIGRDVLKNKNINVIPFLKKSWTDLCKAYLVEAKWYKRGHKPNMEEYMHNAWISVSAPTIFVHFYCLFSDQLSIQVLETLTQHKQNIVRCSAYVVRLANDLATSPDELARGDVQKSIQCYMNETGASEEKARSHVRQMINDLWDEMNYEKMEHSSSLLHHDFMETVINMARMSQCMYQYGDGHGSPEKAKIVDRVMSLLFNPVPLD